MIGRHDPRRIDAQNRMQMPFLTPLEARVVDMITGRNDLCAPTPLWQVSDDAGVSDAMVVQRQIGVASLHSEISPDDSSADIIRKVVQTSIPASPPSTVPPTCCMA